MKPEFLDKWSCSNKKLAYPYEYFNSIDVYQKLFNNFEKEDFLSKLEDDYPNNREIERTREIIEIFKNKNGEELTKIYLKGHIILLTCVFKKFIKVSINEFDINPLYCVSSRVILGCEF